MAMTLRPRLRRARRLRREGRADGPGVPRSRGVPGPSLIIAYSHCIAHGYDMALGCEQQKLAVDSGIWPLYRFDPRRARAGEPPLVLDSGAPKKPVEAYMRNESRFRMRRAADPARFKQLAARAGAGSRPARCALYQQLADWKLGGAPAPAEAASSHRRSEVTMDLSTTYLGFELPHPLMPGASPLADDLDTVRRLEDAGAAAIVHALALRGADRRRASSPPTARTPGRASPSPRPRRTFPSRRSSRSARTTTWSRSRRIKAAVRVPVIASLNGTTPEGWIEYARLIEQAGADALELNLYELATDPLETGRRRRAARGRGRRGRAGSRRDPVAVKLSPFYSSLAHLAARLERAGADGLVLFNRFYQPDIDAENLEVEPAAAPLEPVRAAAAAALAGDPLGPDPGLARGHGRRAQRARRGQGRHGRRARRPDGVGAAAPRARDARARARPSSRAGSRSTTTSRCARCRAA